MKISKIGFVSVLSLMTMIIITSQTYAFGGGREGGREMNQERFEEMKQLFLNNDLESFKAAREERRQSHMEDRKSFRDSITREVNNIDNGVEMTITSSDPEVVEKLQSREEKSSCNEEITKVRENITNGIRITITSSDSDLVEKIQSRKEGMSARGQNGRGGRGSKMRGGDGSEQNDGFRSRAKRGQWKGGEELNTQ